jgi:histidine triad (HIT) family protein
LSPQDFSGDDKSDKSLDDCLFCKIAEKKIPSKIIFESEDVLAFHDAAPQAPVHILIIPKVHLSTVDDINESNHNIMGKLTLTASKIAKDLKLEGYRLVYNCNEIAGQSVFHLHCHLLGGRPMHWPPG